MPERPEISRSFDGERPGPPAPRSRLRLASTPLAPAGPRLVVAGGPADPMAAACERLYTLHRPGWPIPPGPSPWPRLAAFLRSRKLEPAAYMEGVFNFSVAIPTPAPAELASAKALDTAERYMAAAARRAETELEVQIVQFLQAVGRERRLLVRTTDEAALGVLRDPYSQVSPLFRCGMAARGGAAAATAEFESDAVWQLARNFHRIIACPAWAEYITPPILERAVAVLQSASWGEG